VRSVWVCWCGFASVVRFDGVLGVQAQDRHSLLMYLVRFRSFVRSPVWCVCPLETRAFKFSVCDCPYINSWLVSDQIVSSSASVQANKLFRLGRIVRILRLLRLIRMFQLFRSVCLALQVDAHQPVMIGGGPAEKGILLRLESLCKRHSCCRGLSRACSSCSC
jgi:hypothetical protein